MAGEKWDFRKEKTEEEEKKLKELADASTIKGKKVVITRGEDGRDIRMDERDNK